MTKDFTQHKNSAKKTRAFTKEKFSLKNSALSLSLSLSLSYVAKRLHSLYLNHFFKFLKFFRRFIKFQCSAMRANRATALQGLLSCRHYYTNACNDAFFFITHPLAPSAREGERKVGNSAMNGGQNVGNSARDRKHCENARRAMSLRDLTKSNRGFASDSGLRSKCVASAKRTKQNPLNLNCLSIFGLCNDGRNSPSLAEGVRGWVVKKYVILCITIFSFSLFIIFPFKTSIYNECRFDRVAKRCQCVFAQR